MDYYLNIYLDQFGRDINNRIQSMKLMLPDDHSFSNIELAIMDYVYLTNPPETVNSWNNKYLRSNPIHVVNDQNELLIIKPSALNINIEKMDQFLSKLPKRNTYRTTPKSYHSYQPQYRTTPNSYQPHRYTLGGTNYYRTEKTVQFHSRTYRIYTNGTQRYIRYQKKYVEIH